MDLRITITDPAEEDFIGIISFIAGENPIAAEKIAHELRDLFFSLKSFPARGRAEKKYPGIRSITHRHYLIFYRFVKKENAVLILRIWDARQNPKRFTLN